MSLVENILKSDLTAVEEAEDKGSLVIALETLKQAINTKLEAVTAPRKNVA